MTNTRSSSRPGRAALVAVYLVYVAEVARTLTAPGFRDPAPYLALFLLFNVLFTLMLVRPQIDAGWRHAYLAAQCAITLALLALNPELDSITALFAMLAYHAALLLPHPMRWYWVGVLVFLTGASLMLTLGPLRGLALALIPMAVAIVLPAFVLANEDTEQARVASQALVAQLQATHERLQKYAGEVDEWATLQERNRLARELHDSVSQSLFSIMLTTRSAQILLDQDPARVRLQLEQLSELTHNALAQMRGLISELRPRFKRDDHAPTPPFQVG